MPPRETRRKVRPSWGAHIFLNDAVHRDRGWMKATIKWNDWSPIPDINLDIADCSRVIELDFQVESLTRKDKSVRIRKLRRLQKFVNAFVEKAIEAIESAEPFPQRVEGSDADDEELAPARAMRPV